MKGRTGQQNERERREIGEFGMREFEGKTGILTSQDAFLKLAKNVRKNKVDLCKFLEEINFKKTFCNIAQIFRC